MLMVTAMVMVIRMLSQGHKMRLPNLRNETSSRDTSVMSMLMVTAMVMTMLMRMVLMMMMMTMMMIITLTMMVMKILYIYYNPQFSFALNQPH
jgi:hypothetical protein